MRAAVQHVAAAFSFPTAALHAGVQTVHEQRGAIGHCGIHYLTLAAARALVQRCDDAEGQQHPTAAKVANKIERGRWLAAFGADGVQCTGQRDVVDVVSRRVRDGAELAPARHAAVHQPWVAGQTYIWSETQALHHAGTKTFNKHISALDEFEHRFHAVRMFQIHRDTFAPPRQHVGARRPTDGCRTINANDLRAHVRQHHSAERARPDALQFNNLQTREWTHCVSPEIARDCER